MAFRPDHHALIPTVPVGGPRPSGRQSLGRLLIAAVVAVVATVSLAPALGLTIPGSAVTVAVAAPSEPTDPPLLPGPAEEPDTAPGPNRAPGENTVPAESGATVAAAQPVWMQVAQIVLAAVSLLLAVVALTTLAWMLHAWRSPQSLVATGFTRTRREPELSFSLLVPARHEEEVLGDTLDALARLDHPSYEVIAIIGHDDPGTEAVARAAADRHPDIVRVVMDHNVPKNKPKGMNTALPECRGDVVGVFDAEDEVHPELLRLVDARFADTGADVVQGGVQLMNLQSSWWSLRNCLEYYFWFRSRLHFHAEAKFIPLGGNTVFARADVLREVNGWDPECLAEDCELGVRLSTLGKKVVVAYDPDVVTREETPPTLMSLYKQRTRWNQGFLQVLRKGEWKRLPSLRQRLMARYLLSMPFLQAFTGVMIPVAVLLIIFAKVPTVVALITFIPVLPTLVTLVVELAGLGDFGRSYGIKVRIRDRIRLLLGTFPYQVFLAAAAVRAVIREARGINAWEKTEHLNQHRTAAVEPVGELVTVGAEEGGR